MSKNNKSHARAPGMTQISISLPQRLVKKVDRLSEKENRSRSNYIAYIIDRIPEIEEAETAFLEAAQPKEFFKHE